MSNQRTRIWLLGILALALVLRCGAAIAVQRLVERTPGRICLIAGDAEGYWELGRKLARGQNFEIYDPPRRVLRMPGFPAVLALSIAVLGEDVGRARFVLAVIGTMACGCVFWLARDLFGTEIGLIAAALAAVSPTFIVFSVMLLSETTFALGLLLSLIALVQLARKPVGLVSAGRLLLTAFIAGLAAALACYVRPSWLLFPPAAIAIYVVKEFLTEFARIRGNERNRLGKQTASASGGDQSLTTLATGGDQSLATLATEGGTSLWVAKRLTILISVWVVMIGGLAVGLAPWTIRNYFVTDGTFVPTTLWMGPSLYDGLNPLANGDSHMEFLPNSAYDVMSEYDVDRYYRREAWKWAAENPGRVLILAWVKLGRYWNLFPNTPQFDFWYVRAALLAFVVPILGFAICGIACGRKWARPYCTSWSWTLILTLGPILYFSALHTLFVSSLRYRLPAEYPLLALSAVGIWDVWRRMRSTRV